jgi:hypothetical protein
LAISFRSLKFVQLSVVDIVNFDVDALSFTQVLPAMLFRQELDGGKVFGVVYARIVSQRLDPKLIVMFEQCLFHGSFLQ